MSGEAKESALEQLVEAVTRFELFNEPIKQELITAARAEREGMVGALKGCRGLMALLNSMVLSGEDHTSNSEYLVREGIEIIDVLLSHEDEVGK